MKHLVEMQKKHAKDGLEIITVSTDEVENGKADEVKGNVLQVLRGLNAAFNNVILDESSEFMQEKFRFVFAPCVFVFSREGKWTQFRSEDAEVKHEIVEKLVVELLKQK
jgi:hypothetical protein